MTSKKLGALLRSVPPATAPAYNEEVPAASPSIEAPTEASTPKSVQRAEEFPAALAPQPEVPLQVLVPANIRKQLALMSAERGESLRSLILQAVRSLGVVVTDGEILGKRGRRKS